MKIVDAVKLWLISRRRREESRYEEVLREIQDGQRIDGVWAKSFSESDGDLPKSLARYIRYRMEGIRDDEEVSRQIARAVLEKESTAESSIVLPKPKLDTEVKINQPRPIVAADPGDAYMVATVSLGTISYAGIIAAGALGFLPNLPTILFLVLIATAVSVSPLLYYRWRRHRERDRLNKRYAAFASRHKTRK
jgi:hypothetical protein